VPPIPAEAFNVNAADRAWVNRQCTMQPLATFQQPIRLSRASGAPKSLTFILATGFDNSPFPPFYDRARAQGWATMKIDCGHDVMLDRPEELTRALASVAVGQPVSAPSGR
jgi:hypothetical protein